MNQTLPNWHVLPDEGYEVVLAALAGITVFLFAGFLILRRNRVAQPTSGPLSEETGPKTITSIAWQVTSFAAVALVAVLFLYPTTQVHDAKYDTHYDEELRQETKKFDLPPPSSREAKMYTQGRRERRYARWTGVTIGIAAACVVFVGATWALALSLKKPQVGTTAKRQVLAALVLSGAATVLFLVLYGSALFGGNPHG